MTAAIALTTAEGWTAVTMGRLADDVGVSRQTVYNEVGSKAGLAEAMVLTELDRFLSLVDRGFEAHPEDLGAACAARSAASCARPRATTCCARSWHPAEATSCPLSRPMHGRC